MNLNLLKKSKGKNLVTEYLMVNESRECPPVHLFSSQEIMIDWLVAFTRRGLVGGGGPSRMMVCALKNIGAILMQLITNEQTLTCL